MLKFNDLALALLVAGSLLLMPALAGAATQDTKPEAAEAGAKKVSPYAKANRQRVEAAAAAASNGNSVKRPLGQGQVKGKPVHAKRR